MRVRCKKSLAKLSTVNVDQPATAITEPCCAMSWSGPIRPRHMSWVVRVRIHAVSGVDISELLAVEQRAYPRQLHKWDANSENVAGMRERNVHVQFIFHFEVS